MYNVNNNYFDIVLYVNNIDFYEAGSLKLLAQDFEPAFHPRLEVFHIEVNHRRDVNPVRGQPLSNDHRRRYYTAVLKEHPIPPAGAGGFL